MTRSPHSFTVRDGLARVRVWQSTTRRADGRLYHTWQWAWRDDQGQRRYSKRADKEVARAEARALAARVAEGAAALTSGEAAAFAAAKRNLFGCDVSMEIATWTYAQARERLRTIGQDDVLKAVDFFVTHHAGGVADKSLADVVDELVMVRARDGAGRLHLKDLRSRLGLFVRDVKCSLRDLSGIVIDTWLRGLDITNRTRRNYRSALAILFKFARARGYLPDAFNPMKAVPVPKAADPKRGVLRPEELRRLLSHCTDQLLPVLVIGSFAGLRQSEILLLKWEDIDWKAGHIRVSEDGKTGGRWAPLHANLRAWLEPLRGRGPIVTRSASAVCKAVERVVAKANRELASQMSRDRITWPHNACRHSYGSYRCAILRNPTVVADEMGHSIEELARSYRNQSVTPAQAEAWFALLPERSENVLELNFG